MNSRAEEAATLLLIECYAEFENDLVETLLDAGGSIGRFSISPVRLYGARLELVKPRDRVVGSRPGLRAVVEVQGDGAPLLARLRHHLTRAGLSVHEMRGAPLIAAEPAG